MMKSILDTDILSEYLKGHDRNVAKRAEAYAQVYGVFSLTSVTVYEVVYGLEWKSAFVQLRKALRWIQLNEEIVPQAADFLAAASMKAAARKQGSVLELPDCLIAAVAIRLRMTLVTGNTQDFRAIQRTGAELTIGNWRDS